MTTPHRPGAAANAAPEAWLDRVVHAPLRRLQRLFGLGKPLSVEADFTPEGLALALDRPSLLTKLIEAQSLHAKW